MYGHYKKSPLRIMDEPDHVELRSKRRNPWAEVSAADLGQLGGELSRVMVQAAADYVANKALDEAHHSFQKSISQTEPPDLSS